MFKLVVLSALVAVAMAAPRPSGVVAAPAAVAYSAPVVTHSVVPSAVSHQSRVDVVSSPVVATSYSAPLVAAPVVHSAPVVHAAPAVAAVRSVHSVAAVPAVHSVAYSAPLIASHGVVSSHGLVSSHGVLAL